MSAKQAAWIAATGFVFVVVSGVLLRPLLPIDETRYLSVAWEMHLTGDFLVPHKNGEIYTDKPPLLFWLINLVWAVTGISEFAARLIGPAFAAGCLVATGALAGRLWPEVPEIGSRATVILAGFTVFAVYGGLTMFDAMLAFATLAGLFALTAALDRGGWKRWSLYGAALAFGAFSKGPVVLFHLLPVLVLFPLWLPRPSRPKPLVALRGGLFAIAVAFGIVGLWLVPAVLTGGPEYRDAVLWTQSAGRVTQSFGHARPWWWFLALLPVLLFPWVWSPAVWRAVARMPWREPGVRLCLVWSGAALVLFSLTGGKQMHYLIPELPAVALLLARVLSDNDAPQRWELAVVPVGAAAVAAVAAAVGVLPLGDLDPLLQPRPMLVAWALLAIALVWLSLRIGRYRGLAVLGLGLVLTVNLLFGLTGVRPAYDGARIAAVAAGSEAGGVAVHGRSYNAEFNFTGRLQRPVTELSDAGALDAWADQHPDGVIVGLQDRTRLDWPSRETIRFNNRLYSIWFVADRSRAG